MKPPIVFSHANSFPASTYVALFDAWRAAGHEVHAIEKFGHDPRYPVTTDWPHLVRQLKDFIQHEVGQGAYLVGHSLGGYLSLMVASRHPELARGVIALDTPLLHGMRAWSVGLLKSLGAMGRIVPSGVAAQRCHEWPSLLAVREHFMAKPKFAAFHPGVLQAYVEHGTEGHPSATRRLSFQREVEARIYEGMPHQLAREFQHHPLQCPVAYIGGTRSKEVRQIGKQGIRQVFGDHVSWIEGSHLYPFEQPQITSAAVLQWLHDFEAPP
ncbi:MAG: alpha/beta hydrolase [Burkholderiales bacterium]|nr:alpha/beta hydrolase [Burkholderiales bacterium]